MKKAIEIIIAGLAVKLRESLGAGDFSVFAESVLREGKPILADGERQILPSDQEIYSAFHTARSAAQASSNDPFSGSVPSFNIDMSFVIISFGEEDLDKAIPLFNEKVYGNDKASGKVSISAIEFQVDKIFGSYFPEYLQGLAGAQKTVKALEIRYDLNLGPCSYCL